MRATYLRYWLEADQTNQRHEFLRIPETTGDFCNF